MNISEAAKRAAEEIWRRDNSAYLDVFASGAEMRIQSAIDAETAAKDAEIARLKEELIAVLQSTREEKLEGIREKAELVEALKKIAEHASNHDAYALKDMAIGAWRKVGAE